MVNFILLHGTFEPKSEFTLSGSELRASIEEACRASALDATTSIEFRALRWTGKNRYLHRSKAAERLATLVREMSAESRRPIFLIGHSHGGSAVAYFLKKFPELARNVAGSCFLATPFVAMRLRNFWSDVARVIFALICLLIAAVFAKLARVWIDLAIEWAIGSRDAFFPFGFLARSFLEISRNELARLAVLSLPLYLTAIFLMAFLYRRCWTRALRVLRVRLRKVIAEHQTVNLPSGNYLFLRASGDEAAAALSASQAIAWAANKAFREFASWLSALLRLAAEIWRYTIGRVVLLLLGFDCFLLFVYIMSPGLGTWSYFLRVLSPELNLAFEIAFTEGLTRGLLGFHEMVVQPLLAFTLIAAIAASGLFILTAAVSILAARAFGWSGTFEALFVDFAVEPVPVGTVRIHHIPWNTGQSELMHSVTYSDQESLQQLTTWIVEGVAASRADEGARLQAAEILVGNGRLIP